MFCRYCGKEIKEGAKFCPSCGKPTAAPQKPGEESAPEAAASDSSDVVANAGDNRKRTLAIVIAVCVVIVIIIVAAVLLRGRGGKDNVLMAYTRDVRAEAGGVALFGNPEYEAYNVASVTFLDSLKEAPSDAWDVSEKQNGSVMAWMVYQGYNLDSAPCYDLYIAGNGGVQANPDSSSVFEDMIYATSINFNHSFYTDNVTIMSRMFAGDKRLTTLDLSEFDTSDVTDMSAMFLHCWELQQVDVSGWDTSQVTNMYWMFYECRELRDLDVSHWNTSRVTSMNSMFYDCTSLQYLDVSGWDTSQVTDRSNMFNGCSSLQEPDPNTWNTAN